MNPTVVILLGFLEVVLLVGAGLFVLDQERRLPAKVWHAATLVAAVALAAGLATLGF